MNNIFSFIAGITIGWVVFMSGLVFGYYIGLMMKKDDEEK